METNLANLSTSSISRIMCVKDKNLIARRSREKLKKSSSLITINNRRRTRELKLLLSTQSRSCYSNRETLNTKKRSVTLSNWGYVCVCSHKVSSLNERASSLSLSLSLRMKFSRSARVPWPTLIIFAIPSTVSTCQISTFSSIGWFEGKKTSVSMRRQTLISGRWRTLKGVKSSRAIHRSTSTINLYFLFFFLFSFQLKASRKRAAREIERVRSSSARKYLDIQF